MTRPDLNPRTRVDELTPERIATAKIRVADLWPEHLEAVPGSHEVALKRDADTIRAAFALVELLRQAMA